MATELTWACDVNRAVASAASTAEQNKWEAWYLLASLAGNSGLGFNGNAGVWTVVRTCGSTDGTAGNLTADTTDRLHLGSGSYTSNDWVFGANTTAGTGRSWALLQSPSALGSYYLILDFGNATQGKYDLIIGKTLSTNGDTTHRPTLTDEWVYSGAQVSNNSIANTHRVSLHLSTRGDFWFMEAFDTNAKFYSVFGVTKLQSAHSADTYQVVSVFVAANNVATGASDLYFSAGTSNISGTANTVLKGRKWDGSGLPTLVALGYATSGASNPAVEIVVTNRTGTNASDTTYNGLAMWVLDTTNTDLKGRIADALWASGTPAQGSTIPNTTPFNYVKVGHCWLPWVSTSAPLI